MALRLLNHQCIIHRNHRFVSLLSSSRFHGHSNAHHRGQNKLIPFHLAPHAHDDNDEPHNRHNGNYSYYTTNTYYCHSHNWSMFHHTKHRFSSSNDNKMKTETDIRGAPSIESGNKQQTIISRMQPTKLLYRIGSITYNICYYTLDSFVSPSRGYARLCSVSLAIKHGVLHFWGATKLMWTDIRSAWKILRKLRRDGELTYRERRQLRRVAIDALKFVPMLIIALIPFLEAALPLFLWLFPNMLPSRFQTEHMKLEKRKKLLSARIGLAAFFEDTLHEYLKLQNKETESLSQIFERLSRNEEISNEQILRIASLFDDEITLDNASHSVLGNMCRYMDLNTFGTTAMLRHRLYVKIREIRREDQGIRKEGLDNIPEALLRQLLRERGMRSDFQEWVLRSNLSKWLELSLDSEVPVSLLVMSRIFTLQHIPGQDPLQDRLKDAISTIGDATTKEMLVERGGVDDLKTEKEIIERQQQLIDEEEALMKSQQLSSLEQQKEESKRHMRDLTDSVETLASDSAVDPEKQDIVEMREKLKEIKEYSDEYVSMAPDRKKVENKISKRIDKMIEKSSIYADETGDKFENTLKRIDLTTSPQANIEFQQLKQALTDTLMSDQLFSDQQIEHFLKEFQLRKAKQPNIKLSKLIEELSDEYHQDMDIRDN